MKWALINNPNYMKKTLILTAAGALALGLASCSQEAPKGNEGNGGNVVLKVTRPGDPGTRVFGDGTAAWQLDYAIYEAESQHIVSTGEAIFENGALTTTVSLTLGNGKNYKIAFLAHLNKADQAYVLDTENKILKVNYDKMSNYNVTDNDAFFKLHETGVIKGAVNQNVELIRPMAQVNWGTSDLDTDAVLTMYNDGTGRNNLGLKTGVTIEGVYDSYNFWTNTFGNEVTATFPAAARPDSAEQPFPHEPATYRYLSMGYVLVPSESQTLVTATLTPQDAQNVTYTPTLSTFTPVQGNYRTNIFGTLLTATGQFTVEKVPAFTNYNNVTPGQNPQP